MGYARTEIIAPASTPLSSGEITPVDSTPTSQFRVDFNEIVGISRAYRNQTERSYLANYQIPELPNPMGIAFTGLVQNITTEGVSPATLTRFSTDSFTEVLRVISERREDAMRKGALFAVEIADEKPIDGVGEVLGRTVLVDNLLESPQVLPEANKSVSAEIIVPTLASKLESIRQVPSHILVYIIDSGPQLEEAYLKTAA